MPQICTICKHSARADIDAALVGGQAFRNLAEQYGTSATALHRHKAEHLPVALIKAREAEEIAQADDLLAQVRELKERMETQYRFTQHILAKAAQADELRTMLLAVREASNVNREMRGCLELLAKLLGQIDERTTVNILINPQWVSVRALLMDALQDYPEARVAVAASLQQLEGSQQ